MKIALYIEDGIEQIILTPQTPVEKSILAKLHDASRTVDLKRGQFYECRGGWVRFNGNGLNAETNVETSTDSTMIVLRRKTEAEG